MGKHLLLCTSLSLVKGALKSLQLDFGRYLSTGGVQTEMSIAKGLTRAQQTECTFWNQDLRKISLLLRLNVAVLVYLA